MTNDFVARHSAGILRVAAKTDPKNLASAIVKMLREKSIIQVRAAGPQPINNAVKGCIIADGQLSQRNKSLFIRPTFDVTQDAQDNDFTVVVFSITVIPFNTVGQFFNG